MHLTSASSLAPSDDHMRAVELARTGDTKGSLRQLSSLLRAYPKDLSLRRDYCVVLSWAGRFEDSIGVYLALPPEEPDYILIAAGLSYRRLHRFAEALDIYEAGADRFPDELEFLAGRSLTLTDMGRAKEALATATEGLSENNNAIPLLLAAGYASVGLNQPAEALGYYDQALRLDPKNIEARRQQAFATELLRNRHRRVNAPRAAAAPSGPSSRQAERRVAQGSVVAPGQNPWQAPRALHDQAIFLARSGRIAEGLRLLRNLVYAYPKDPSLLQDLVVVLGWAERDQEATQLFVMMQNNPKLPDYVLLSAASSFRRLHYYHRALELFQLGAARFPNNLAFAAGQSLTLTDLKQPAAGLKAAEKVLGTHPYSVDLLLAAGYAEMQLYQPVDALRFYDRALRLDPANREANRSRIFAIEEMGAPQVALKLADRHPGLMSAQDRRRLLGSEAAQLVRFGEVEPASVDRRFEMTDRAIRELDTMIAEWQATEGPTGKDVARARLDRMVAYRDRVRMRDVIHEYLALKSAGIEIPIYVMEAVADAYLYLEEPEHARRAYQTVLRGEPRFFSAKMGLFYSLIETEHFEEALALIDKTDAEEPKWIWLKGAARPLPNPSRETADLGAAQARVFSEDLRQAQQRYTALVRAGPANVSFINGLGNVYEARGWYRRARDEYALGEAIAPQDISLSIDHGENDLALRNYTQALQRSAVLSARYPERKDVQSLARHVDLYQRGELHLSIDKTYSPNPTGITGGNSLVIEGQIFSPMMFDHWRIFADDYVAHQREPNDEGNITLRELGAGLEYRGGPVVASASLYNGRYGRIGLPKGSNLGGQASISVDLDDYWTIGGQGSIFSRDTPLRALRRGVTADAGSLSATFRASELQSIGLTAGYVPFSDGNNRMSIAANYAQRVYTSPHIKVDALASAGIDHNTKSNVSYFNPHMDGQVLMGAQADQILYRRYNFQWDHRLTAEAGPYVEQAQGTSITYEVRYEHRLHTSDTFDVGGGVVYHNQSYGGTRQPSIDFLADLTWKF